MPTSPIDNRELQAIIRLAESAPYELLLSFGAFRQPLPRHETWARRAEEALGAESAGAIRAFLEALWHPQALLELPVDYPGATDETRGFLDYLAALDVDRFLFYLTGRVIPPADVAAYRRDPEGLVRRLHDFYEAQWPGSGESHTRGASLRQAVAAPAAMQQHLVALLRAWDERVFRAELPDLQRHWAASIQEKRRGLDRQEPLAFLRDLTDKSDLPPMYPEGTPLREIRVTPSLYLGGSNLTIWGYGTVIVLYNAYRTEAWEQERDQAVGQLTVVAAALADPNRLKILAAIAQDPESYGHKLARLCGISQPAVSRHMGILKRAHLVEEVPSEGRILYRLCRETLEDFQPRLFSYLRD